jgi:hypothetical protein
MNPCSQGGLLRCGMALGTNDCWAMRMYAGEKVGGPSLTLGQEVTFHDAQIRNLILKCLFNMVDLVIHVAVCVLFKVMTRTFLLARLYPRLPPPAFIRMTIFSSPTDIITVTAGLPVQLWTF